MKAALTERRYRMAPIAVLHLMNGFGDASISRIVQRLVESLGDQDFSCISVGYVVRATCEKSFDGWGLG